MPKSEGDEDDDKLLLIRKNQINAKYSAWSWRTAFLKKNCKLCYCEIHPKAFKSL